MELSQLRYFAKAAELLNFTKAAEACYVAQPSLSQQILKLEQELGRPLFDRVGRSVRLTDAGRFFKERADQAIKLIDEAQAQLADAPDVGRLVVGAIPTIAPYLLPRLVRDFTKPRPNARIDVVEDVTAGLVRRCREAELDLALVAAPAPGSTWNIQPLFEEELLLVLAKNHPLAGKPRLTLKDLADQPFVLLGDAHCLTGSALSFCHNRSFQPIQTAQVQQLATVLELVSLGQGVSLVPAMSQAFDRSPSRVYRSLSGDKPTRTVALAWHPDRFQSRLFLQFIAFLTDRLRPG